MTKRHDGLISFARNHLPGLYIRDQIGRLTQSHALLGNLLDHLVRGALQARFHPEKIFVI